jgi:small conductance mechanosensitive channel
MWNLEPVLGAAAGIAGTNAPASNERPTLAQQFQSRTGLPAEVAHWAVNIAGAIIILVIGSIVAGIIRNLIKRVCARRAIEITVASFAGNLVHALIMTFVVISALERLGVDTKSFAAVIAAAGLAIGLALQGGLANFAAGFLIIVFRPFKAGDTVNGAGVEGTVEEVQVFSTTLNTPDNKKIIIPNSALMSGIITNYTANTTRRVDIAVSVGAGQELALSHQVLIATAQAHPKALKTPPPSAANVKLVDGGTSVELRTWCKTGDYGDVLNDLLQEIPAALARANIKGPDKTVYYVERK